MNYANLAAPISEVIKSKNKKFIWTEEANKSFEILKLALVSEPVLGNPDFTKPFYIQTDASDFAVAGVLFQRIEECERVICYFSKKMTSQQLNYSVTEKEALAVLLSVEKFRPYIDGVRFHVISDHASLKWLFDLKNPSGRLARWVMRMQQFSFDVKHRPGSQNVVPDALSRDIATLTVGVQGGSLIDAVTANPGKYPDFKIVNGVLYKHILDQSPVGDYRFGWRIYVDKFMVKDVLHEMHNDVLSGHFGFFKTLSKVREKYYWPGMHTEIKTYVQSCEVCKAVKSASGNSRVPMGAPKTAKRPWQLISIDFLGPFVRSKNGNTMLIVAIDWFSKFVLLQPIRQATSRSVIKFLENQVFSIFGACQRLVSDNGTQFTSRMFKDFLTEYKVKHWLNASYHAQTNPSERSNRVILAAVRAFLDDNHKEWDVNISKIGSAINSAVHESTKCSPYAINFGYRMISDGSEHARLDKLIEHLPPNMVPDNIEDFVSEKHGLMQDLREQVQQNIRNAYNRYSKYYNLRTRSRTFQKGDIVWKKNFSLSDASKNISAKLNDRRTKCRIKNKVGSNTYELEDCSGKRLGIFHAKDIS